jgi:hypothetical protein
MKKIFINFVALFCITGAVYAQEFYFGFSPGEMSNVYAKTGDKTFTLPMNIFQLTGNFVFSVIFKNNVELETGIMYYNQLYYIKVRMDNGKTFRMNGRERAYHALSLPVHVGYKFKLANCLYAHVYSGLNFDFYFASTNIEYMPYKYPGGETYEERGWNFFGDLGFWAEGKLQKHFNIMFANRFSIQYFTKFNMGISLYASYYSGLRQVWESTFHYTYDFGETMHKNTYISHGSFWNFGIELGFKLPVKKEERKVTSSLRKEQRKKIIEMLNEESNAKCGIR